MPLSTSPAFLSVWGWECGLLQGGGNEAQGQAKASETLAPPSTPVAGFAVVTSQPHFSLQFWVPSPKCPAC